MSARGGRPTEEQVQEDLMRLEAYRNQLNALLQQHQMLSNSRADHDRARETLEGLERIEPSREVVIPLGAETFVRGQASPGSPVMVGLGSGIIAELDRSRVVELLHERSSRIDQATRDLEGQIRSIEERVEVLSQKLDALARDSDSAPEAGPDDVGRD
jgi:prefoldin alpha subunit